MRHIKIFESFKPITLIDVPDPMKVIKDFCDVLDFPRQNEDGFLLGSGVVDYEYDIKGKSYEDGYRWIKENPEILEIPEIKKLLSEWSILGIEFLPDGDIQVTYEPMTKSQWDIGGYDDTGMSYKEYLEEFGE
jgi:hypothetical protein